MALVKFKNRAGQWVELVIDNLTTESAVQALSAKQGKVLQTNKADKATTLAGYGIINAYTKTEIDALISAIFKYKGVKATVADVEAVVDPRIGDVWFVTADSSEYAWNGTKWEKLGPVIDLSHFITQISIAGLTIDAQSTTITKDQLLTALGVYTKTEVDEMKEEVDEHLENIDSIISTDTETVTGSLVTIETKSAQIVEKTVIHIEPVQDLHGYDNPWPGGGTKNILPMVLPDIKSNNTTGTWNGNVYTLNNITFTVVVDSDDNVLGIKVNTSGASGATSFRLMATGRLTLEAGTAYYLSGNNGAGGNGTVRLTDNATQTFTNNSNGDQSCTIPSGWVNSSSIAIIRIESGATFSNFLFTPMLRLAKVSDGTFIPYSNICPISGWTGAKVSRTGKNLYNGEKTNGYYINDSGVIVDDAASAYSDLIDAVPNTEYTFSGICTQGGSGTKRIHAYDADGNWIALVAKVKPLTDNSTFSCNGTTPNNCAFIRISYYGNETWASVCDRNMQVELGSTATSYEPYAGQTYPITFPSQAGTVYGGTVKVEKDGTGKLTVDLKIYNYDGSTFIKSSSTAADIFVIDGYSSEIANWDLTKSIKSNYEVVGVNIGDVLHKINISNAAQVRWAFSEYGKTSLNDFKAMLSSVNLQMLVYLATPVTYSLTPVEVETLLGINNVWADTGNIELTFRKGAFATLEDVHYITESSEDASIYHLGFCIKDGKLCQIYYKEEE